ncbi:MAG: O-antigen polysaccharide polymerase Wzy family protein [Oscillospiraceae bacterium]|jgi:oligosaccharide repeat unit polymerase|nr:O-antigen polysaccharide polymerase Wzy family protein [Oscillospiraceae bacterium]
MTADRLRARSTLRNTLFFGVGGVLLIAANLMPIFNSFFYAGAVYVLLWANFILNIGILCDLCSHFRRDFPMLVFTLSFDLLLLGRVYIAFWAKDQADLLYNLEASSYENLFSALQIVTFALLFAYAGYKLCAPLFLRREKALAKRDPAVFHNDQLTPLIRQISKIVLLISSLAFFFMLVRSISVVLRYGYLGSYTKQIENEVPSVISRLSMFFVPSFAVFLATLPDRRQLRLPLLVYGVYMLSSLLTGRRNTFVCEALMLLIYFVLRDRLLPKEQRLVQKKRIVPILILAVVLVYLLQVVAVRRSGSGSGHNLLNMISNFIYSQGATYRVVQQTVNCWDRFDHQTAWQFIFYPCTEFVHNNPLTQTIFGLSPIVSTQSTQYVLTNYNLAHVLTYMVDPARYLSGGGFGTTYVAEAYLGFGMAGVAVVSGFFGVAFRFFSSMLTRSWPVLALSLLAVKELVYVPRNFALSWVFNTFSITYLLYFIGIYLLALLIARLGAHLRRTNGSICPAREVPSD